MSNWLRFVSTFVKSLCRSKISPLDESVTTYRVWITDADISLMNESRYLTIFEMGRLDLMIRSRFIWQLIKKRYFAPVASISIQFLRPVKRFQKVTLKTKICFWDERHIYLAQRIFVNEKMTTFALVRSLIKHGKEVLPLSAILKDLGYQDTPLPKPEYILAFEKSESLARDNFTA